VRDAIVRRGAKTLNFGAPSDGILFQVLQVEGRAAFREPRVISLNFVDFTLYAALLLGELLLMLEQPSEILAQKIHVETIIEVQTIGPDFDSFLEWLTLYERHLISLQEGEQELSPASRRAPPIHRAIARLVCCARGAEPGEPKPKVLRAFLSDWLPRTWASMAAFIEAREKSRALAFL
jgi:hypothetical protein